DQCRLSSNSQRFDHTDYALDIYNHRKHQKLNSYFSPSPVSSLSTIVMADYVCYFTLNFWMLLAHLFVSLTISTLSCLLILSFIKTLENSTTRSLRHLP